MRVGYGVVADLGVAVFVGMPVGVCVGLGVLVWYGARIGSELGVGAFASAGARLCSSIPIGRVQLAAPTPVTARTTAASALDTYPRGGLRQAAAVARTRGSCSVRIAPPNRLTMDTTTQGY